MNIVKWLAVGALALAAACNSVRVTASSASISADPLSLDFGNQTAGSQTTMSVTLTNSSVVALNITSATIGGDTRSAFSVGPAPTTLSAGSSATLQVTYAAPLAPGADGATLTIASDAGNSPQLAISLTGRSMAACLPETDAAFCARLGKDCGAVTAADNCGAERTVASCGTCAIPQVCGGLGVDNVCDTPVFPVTVTLAGAGSGKVVSTPGGINCGAACSASFSSGSSVALTAVADTGSSFAGFSGDCTGATCTLDVSAAANVTATFVPLHTLTVLASGSGGGTVTSTGGNAGIACTASSGAVSGACTAQLPEGTSMDLSASAASGSRFDGWSGACSGATCSLALTSDLTVTAAFVATFPITVTLAGTGTGAVESTPAGIDCGPTCSSTFDSGTAVTLAATPSGGSTFAGFSGDCSGATCAFASLSASANVTATFNAPAAKLVFTQEPPATAQSGIALSQAVKVSVEDASGNVVTGSNASISLSPSGDSLAGGGAQAAVNGIATFNLTLTGAAGSFTLQAQSSGLSSATSSAIALAAGSASQLVFTQEPPATAQSGIALSQAVKVSVEDASGNVVTGSNASISLSPSGDSLAGGTAQAAVNGIATFNLTLTGAAGSFTLQAQSSGLSSATSSAIALAAGSTSQLVFMQEPPATAQSGIALSQAVKVAVEDASGNVVTNSTASISLSPSGDTLAGGTAQAAVNGIATFNLTLTGAAGSFTLQAQSSGLSSATSSAIALGAGSASQLVFTQEPPATAQSGVGMSTVKVSVEDSAGNVVTSSSASITLTSSAGGSALSGGGAQSALSGAATFTPTLTATAGTYTLTAASNGLSSAVSTNISLSAGSASQLVFTQEPPAAAQSGIAISAVKVSVEDAVGNVVTNSNASIGLSSSALTSSGGTLSGGAAQAATNGVATFNLTLTGAVGNYTLATQSSFTAVSSTSIALSAGNASQLVFGQQPTNANAGATLSPAITVKIEDSAGNVVNSSATIALSTTPSTSLSGTTSVAALVGVATFSDLSIATANTYTLSATSSPLAGATSSSFTIAPSNTWTTVAPEVEFLGSSATTGYNGKLYVMGGSGTLASNYCSGVSGSNNPSSQAYDPSTDLWANLACMPGGSRSPGRYGGNGAATIDGNIYVAGGWTQSPALPSSDLFIYSVANDSWSTGTSMPSSFNACGVSVASGSKLYVYTTCNGESGYANSVYIYDSTTSTWSNGTSPPHAHAAGPTGGLIDGKWYLVGGLNGSSSYSCCETAIDVYDTVAGTWSTTTSTMPASLYGSTSGVINGKLYVAGGYDGSEWTGLTYVYDPVADTWTQLASMSPVVWNPTGDAVNGQLYVVGSTPTPACTQSSQCPESSCLNGYCVGLPTTVAYQP